jgi:hypothetical protein
MLDPFMTTTGKQVSSSKLGGLGHSPDNLHLHFKVFKDANVIKLFTTVIYCHSMVILSFCVIKQHYLGNYCRMAVITMAFV